MFAHGFAADAADSKVTIEDIMYHFKGSDFHWVRRLMSKGAKEELRPKIRDAIEYFMDNKELRDTILLGFKSDDELELDENKPENVLALYEKYVDYLSIVNDKLSAADNLPELLEDLWKNLEEHLNEKDFKELQELLADFQKPAKIELSTIIRGYMDRNHLTEVYLKISNNIEFETEYSLDLGMIDGGEKLRLPIYDIFYEIKHELGKKFDERGYISLSTMYTEGENTLKVNAAQYVPRNKITAKLFEPYRMNFSISLELDKQRISYDELDNAIKKLKSIALKQILEERSIYNDFRIAQIDDTSQLIADLEYLAISAEIINSWKDKEGNTNMPEKYQPIKEQLISAGWPLQQ